ncbi:uncharacterized protein LOC141656988 [Silene latifolia]|uniref:uncharacterized protein LOC141656988 n=1 Tax=Silene latifolia TaxID=37657 RepID=UPI003D76E43A
MASDKEIAEGLESLFRDTNPNSFSSLNDVILRLQSNLGFDLSHKIDFIRSHISLLFSPIPTPIPQIPPISRPLISPIPNPNPNLHPHAQGYSHVFYNQSHFPRGPTQICFAQPGGVVGNVVGDAVSGVTTAKDSGHRPKRRGGPGGLNKLCGVTPQLQAIVGQPTMPRTEIVKQLWAYIRKNNLQDPSNKRKIICNEELRLVFEVDCTDMFQMNKLLSKHILPLDPKKDLGQQSKKLKDEESQAPKSEPQVPSSEPQVPSSEPQVPKSELPAPLIVISEALAKFFGTSKKEMLQSDVYKRIEEYIKAEGLEDTLNSTVLCDTKLQELLGCESTTFSAIRDALACNHLFQQS